MSVLTSDNVNKTFMDCLSDNADEVVVVEGVVHTVSFDKEKLESHREEVRAMLDELTPEFRKSVGGGWSFLNACLNKDGEQWTGLHLIMEQLFQLGEGLGLIVCQMPRNMWDILPGGMPYYVYEDE